MGKVPKLKLQVLKVRNIVIILSKLVLASNFDVYPKESRHKAVPS